MNTTNLQTMNAYLSELVDGGDFTEIPMVENVQFVGPLASADNAETYRSICSSFAESVHDISVRTLVGAGDLVHAVYDVDMGLPSGPLPTSQTVEFVDGAFSSVEVIFDGAAIAGATT